jgi:hypothetical protein
MPEQDFELYLSLLSRFLRLKSAQRGEIADELRDHLEARLEELAARGLSHDEAIRTALDEFGDAAELAKHFTQVAHTRKRRLIMRVTFGTVTALAASLLVATAFWPETRQVPVPQRAMAQESPAANQPKRKAEPAIAATDDGRADVEAKLSKPIGDLPNELSNNIVFTQWIDFLGQLLDVDILLDRIAIGEADIDLNSIVDLHIKRTKLTGRTALDLLLEPLKLSYTIRDGLIMVTTAEKANQIQVYNIRDLLPNSNEYLSANGAAGSPTAPAPADGHGNGQASAPAPAKTMTSAMGGRGGMGGGGMGGMGMGAAGGMGGMLMGGGMGGMGRVFGKTDSLAQLIATTIDPESWEFGGGEGTGSVVQYHELLVVKNSQLVHGKIKALLEMMRTSAGLSRMAPVPGAPAPQTR